jgi:succinate dehydrogenase / fumarate reductase iron-sulfur subunit
MEIDPKERVLDGLHKIKWDQDGTLTFRRSCAHGICGSDAMRINGKNRLACKTLIKDLNPEKPITVEPIKGLTVLKDLVVDMDPFFQAYRDVMPFLITKDTNEPTRERLQTAEDRERFDDTTKCILCAACTSSCPVFWNDGQYFGPAAIVNAHRFIFDSRDEAGEQRLEILNDRDGVWRCRTTFNCTDACPARHRGHQGDPGSEAGADPRQSGRSSHGTARRHGRPTAATQAAPSPPRVPRACPASAPGVRHSAHTSLPRR